MKSIAILFCLIFAAGFWIFTSLLEQVPRAAQNTPNSNLALEARVTTLEGQVKELRRVVGIDKGLSEGLQNRGKKK